MEKIKKIMKQFGRKTRTNLNSERYENEVFAKRKLRYYRHWLLSDALRRRFLKQIVGYS